MDQLKDCNSLIDTNNNGLSTDDSQQQTRQHDNVPPKTNPIDSDALVKKAGVLLMQGKNEKAMTYVDRVLVINPVNMEALNIRGRIFYSQSRLQESLECFIRVLELEPDNIDALLNKANILFYGFKKYRNTVECCDLILNANPNDKSAIYLKNQALEKLALQDSVEQNHGGISP